MTSFFRRKKSLDITECETSHKVVYLGNVLTMLAKGEGCADKPLMTLWKNYSVNQRKDIKMKLRICNSGLKAETPEHGLTEYHAHLLTFCGTLPDYPRLFFWIYRHEGKKMKPELRFHAAFCSKAGVATQMASLLSQKVVWALNEFKREKVSKQNARKLHEVLAEIAPSVCKRRQILSTGKNFRPELERSKSAPRLLVIEEDSVIEEVQEEEPEEEVDCMSSTLKRQSSNGSCSVVSHPLTVSTDSYRDHETDEDDGYSPSWSVNSSPAGSWNVKRKGAAGGAADLPLGEPHDISGAFTVSSLRKAIEETSSVESGYGDECRLSS